MSDDAMKQTGCECLIPQQDYIGVSFDVDASRYVIEQTDSLGNEASMIVVRSWNMDEFISGLVAYHKKMQAEFPE